MSSSRRNANTRRDKKQQALASLRSGGGLDDYEVKEDDDIYDVVDEDEYQELVKKRRHREDFVVDDDGLGYYDDGEEHIGSGSHRTGAGQGDGDEAEDAGNKRKAKNKTAEAIKKARRLNALESAAMKTSKITKFLHGSVAGTSKHNSNGDVDAAMLDTDALLQRVKLQRMNAKKGKKKKKKGKSSSSNRSKNKVMVDAAALLWQEDDVDVEEKRLPVQQQNHSLEEEEEHACMEFNPCVEDTEEINDATVTNEEKAEEKSFTSNTVPKQHPKMEETSHHESPIKRRTFAKSKATTISAAAMKSLEDKKEPTTSTDKKEHKVKDIVVPDLAVRNNLDDASASAFGSSVDWKAYLHPPTKSSTSAQDGEDNFQKEEAESKTAEDPTKSLPYVDLYYYDATENKGVITLYGKASSIDGAVTTSCAIQVHNNLHNLYLLPREGKSMLDVHGDVKEVLHPVLPKQKQHGGGSLFKAKVVKRNYAFDNQDVPRGEQEYLKVAYDATLALPERDVCERGGKSWKKCLGFTSTVLERFLVKRKIKGPTWLRIYDPVPNPKLTHWTKLSLICSTPKHVYPTPSPSPPPPKVRTCGIKFKAIVHPKTHKPEIVCASLSLLDGVDLETQTDPCDSNLKQTSLTLVRPLGSAAQYISSTDVLPVFPSDLDQTLAFSKNKSNLNIQKSPNERALISRVLATLGAWDPDVIVGHNCFGYDLPLLLNRCIELKVGIWSKVGRRRNMTLPYRHGHFDKDYNVTSALTGRIVCDTYLSCKELSSNSTNYSLSHLSQTLLNVQRIELPQVDVPHYFGSSSNILQLSRHTLTDSQLTQRLMLHVQALPLTKQLTNIAGNIWQRTLRGHRAERNEYLLLHEFHALKYIVPEKKALDKKKTGSNRGRREKATYSGGLVLEPKRGLYDTFILLLDFNSLYPSIIQEYNLCFTTVEWNHNMNSNDDHDHEEFQEEEEVRISSTDALPPLPTEGTPMGILPRVIQTLVQRRRTVKSMLKNERIPSKRSELDVRQRALKLTANSMYGCLGFSNSRFQARPIAALITSLGRNALQTTVDVATDKLNLEVIYGDTDSVMINTHRRSTRISDSNVNNSLALDLKHEYTEVMKLGHKVKQAVNMLYKTLELEIDGVFSSMLLLKKKKYAALSMNLDTTTQELCTVKETKGLDLVRRDWCVASKDCGRYVLDQILSSDVMVEEAVQSIHDHLSKLADGMRNNTLPLEKYVITKGLSKHPNDYPDAKAQPHVWVARRMLGNQQPVNVGDHIPYVICLPKKAVEEKKEREKSGGSLLVYNAYHPDEMERDPELKVDVEWYLKQQILPPIARLCEPIAGTDQRTIGEKLGLDVSNYTQNSGNGMDVEDGAILVDYIPASALDDAERFKACEKLYVTCASCRASHPFEGCFSQGLDANNNITVSYKGFHCSNEECRSPYFGESNRVSCYGRINAAIVDHVHKCTSTHYACSLVCDDLTCGYTTHQPSLLGQGQICHVVGCRGVLRQVFPATMLHTQLKYLDSLFSIHHATRKMDGSREVKKKQLEKSMSAQDRALLGAVNELVQSQLKENEGNWVSHSFFDTLFTRNRKRIGRNQQAKAIVSP